MIFYCGWRIRDVEQDDIDDCHEILLSKFCFYEYFIFKSLTYDNSLSIFYACRVKFSDDMLYFEIELKNFIASFLSL